MSERIYSDDGYTFVEDLFEKERDEFEPFFAAGVASEFGGTIRVDTLYKRFFTSPYGQHMREQPLRFPRQEYDREQKLQDLGIDVDPVLHMFEAALFTARILKAEQDLTGKPLLTDEETGIVMLATILHDVGEVTHSTIEQDAGGSVGDIPFGNKTDDDRALEASVRIALYVRLFPDVSVDVLQRVEAIISHSDDSILHDIFEAAHTIQCYNTAMMADQALTTNQNPEHLEKILSVRDCVQRDSISDLQYWSDRFIFVEAFEQEHRLNRIAAINQEPEYALV